MNSLRAVGELPASSTLLFVFDLDETLVVQIDQGIYPIPEAVAFISNIMYECASYSKNPLFTILTTNTNEDDIFKKVAILEAKIKTTHPNFYITTILKRPDTQDLPRKTYQHIMKLYKDKFGTPHIPYPTFFFDNLNEQVESVHNTALDYYQRRGNIYLQSFLITDPGYDEGSSWNSAQREINPIIHTPNPISLTTTSNLPPMLTRVSLTPVKSAGRRKLRKSRQKSQKK